jgi:hypothetical protein
MNKREIQIAFLILCLAALFPVAWLMAIDWIQYDERAVGENSPYYDDVVNRPAKQVFGVFTSEHNPDGTHRIAYLTSDDLTGYATTGDLADYMLISTYDGDADDRADTAEVLSDGTNISNASAVRAHLDNTSVHFSINDSATSTTSVWSSDKIQTELDSIGGLPILSDTSEPDIDSDSGAFWHDSYAGQYWLILDVGGTQVKVELQ